MLESRDEAPEEESVPGRVQRAPRIPIRALCDEIAALELDLALNLSRQQAGALLPLLEDSRAKVEAMKAQRAAASPALAEALTRAMDDLVMNGTASGATREALSLAMARFPRVDEHLFDSFWQEASRGLTASQLHRLKTPEAGTLLTGRPDDLPYRSFHREHLGDSPTMHTLISDPFLFLVRRRAQWSGISGACA